MRIFSKLFGYLLAQALLERSILPAMIKWSWKPPKGKGAHSTCSKPLIWASLDHRAGDAPQCLMAQVHHSSEGSNPPESTSPSEPQYNFPLLQTKVWTQLKPHVPSFRSDIKIHCLVWHLHHLTQCTSDGTSNSILLRQVKCGAPPHPSWLVK